MSELKEHVRTQYQRMHALLEANQAETMQMLDSTYATYARKNSHQALQLNEKHQEAEKLLSSVQTFFQRADSVNFMKVQVTHAHSHMCIHVLHLQKQMKCLKADPAANDLCVLLSFSEHKTVPAANGQVGTEPRMDLCTLSEHCLIKYPLPNLNLFFMHTTQAVLRLTLKISKWSLQRVCNENVHAQRRDACHSLLPLHSLFPFAH